MHEEVTHPCIQHKLALIRDQETDHKMFRELATEITMFVCYEALKNIRVKAVDVQTPLATAKCNVIDEHIVVIPILRAGVGMLDGILALVPTARGAVPGSPTATCSPVARRAWWRSTIATSATTSASSWHACASPW